MTEQHDESETAEGKTAGPAGIIGRVFGLFPGGVFHRPLVIGIIAGIIGFFFLATMLPQHAPAPATVTAPVRLGSEEAPAQASAMPANETPQAPQEETAQPPAPDVPVVAEAAIVVADAGLNRRVAEAIDRAMPREATLAISVYATEPAATATAFRNTGRDVWLQIAAQSTRGNIDPGPLALAANLGVDANMELLKRQMAMAGGSIVGIFVPYDADITGDQAMWRDLATNVIGSNLMVLDATRAKVATTLYMQRSESSISAYLKADVSVSGDLGPAALQKALADAIPVILKQQQAIVVLNRPTVLSVQTLGEWIATLRAQGIRLVPASEFTGLKP